MRAIACAALIAAVALAVTADAATATRDRNAAVIKGRRVSSLPAIAFGGKSVPRAGPDFYKPLPSNTQTAVDLFYKTMLTLPPLSSTLFGCHEERDAAAANTAMNTPLNTAATNALGGKLVVMTPGAGSFGPSAAQVFRLARYAQRVVLVAYNAVASASGPTPVQATQIDGIPVPSALAGKIWVMGDLSHRAFLDQYQCQDTIVDALASIHNHAPAIGMDPLTSGAILVGHSQGSFCVSLARRALNAAGLGAAVSKVVTLSGGLGDTSVQGADGVRLLFTLLNAVEKIVGGGNASPIARYMAFTDSLAKGQQTALMTELRALVDLGVGSAVGHGHQAYVAPQFKLSSEGLDFVSALANPLALVNAYNSNAGTSTDGILPLAITLAGKKTHQLVAAHDHAYVIADFRVVDEWAAQL